MNPCRSMPEPHSFSEVTFKDKTSYRDVSVSGDIFARD